MPEKAVFEFMHEVKRVGKALRKVTGAEKINYEMYSNSGTHLHIHLFPRYLDDCLSDNGDSEMYEHFGEDIASTAFYIVDTPHTKRVEGFPLDCLSVDIQTGKYYYDKAESRLSEDREQTSGFRAFFEKVIDKGDQL